ncbi:hypothetical protein ACVW1A_000272 [Bradyrhizobium sp. LB1.3]
MQYQREFGCNEQSSYDCEQLLHVLAKPAPSASAPSSNAATLRAIAMTRLQGPRDPLHVEEIGAMSRAAHPHRRSSG